MKTCKRVIKYDSIIIIIIKLQFEGLKNLTVDSYLRFENVIH